MGVMLLFTSCNSWLQVEPDDRIMDKELFKDKDGFMITLNGIYSELNRPSLYGANLSMGVIDVLGQYYNCNVSNHDYALYMKYSYGDKECKARFDAVWSDLYSLIANCNTIIEHCGEGNPVLPDVYYRMIKGECLALRAMMHLDLLRMFGPVWSESGKATLCIPYMTVADRSVQPLLRADSVLVNVIRDLKTASALLEPVDPVITRGAENIDTELGENDMNYRQYRLNYFAVNALLARAYLWGNDKVSAGSYARDVIAKVTDANKPLFPLVESSYVESYSDFVFSPEVLFSLYNTSRTDAVYNMFFSPTLDARNLFTLAGNYSSGRVRTIYDDENDLRFRMWQMGVENGEEIVYLRKFRTINTFAFSYMIPLIRVSELYLIAAECDDDVQHAIDTYINPLRFSRRSVNQSASSREELERLIQAESLREFIGEGQMFFYYKRKAMLNIPNGGEVNSSMNIALDSYVFPLPDSETSQRGK